MIVATRLSAVWQVAGVAGAALCCYLVSQSVASERAGLEKVDQQISQTHDDIAKLQTEIGVRARQGQLEAWNREVLALQAPRPSQFVSSGLQLASLYGHHGQPALQLDPAIASQQGSPTNVAYQQPAQPQQAPTPAAATAEAPAPAPAQPMLRTANYVRPAPSRLAAPAMDAAPTMQKASFVVIKTPAPVSHLDLAEPKPAKVEPKPAAKVADKKAAEPKVAKSAEPKPLKTAEAKPAKPKAEPVRLAARDPLPKSLLPADIGALAAREAHGAKDSSKAAR
jgi:hypothetical protein